MSNSIHTSRTGLNDTQKTDYKADGFVSGIQVFDNPRVAELRSAIEALEADHDEGVAGHDINQLFRVNGHIVIPLLAELARTPAILNAVEDILGPNLLAWSVELFIKEPRSEKTVSWHQDITYWGMGETNDEVTAWIALSDVSVEAGCMRFIPGSHKNGIVNHDDTFDDNNLLSRGQQIGGIDEANARHGPLNLGEMSLHHGRCFHASGPNRSDDRRIGLAIRYVTPEVREGLKGNDYAMLVRGIDGAKGWTNIAGPRGLFCKSDVDLYDAILSDQTDTLAEDADEKVDLYAPKASKS